MRRVRLLAVATAVCLLTPTVVWVSPASATPSLTVTPNAGLKIVSVVHVEGAGFPASARVLVCEAVIDATPGQDDCDRRYPVAPIGTDRAGTFAVDMFVDLIMYPSADRTVDCSIERCGVIAGVFDDFANTAIVAPTTFLPGHPDGRIKRRSDGQIFGDNNVSLLSWTHTIAPGGYWTYALQVQNDSNTTDDIDVSAGGPGILGNVQFFYGYYDVTSYVLNRPSDSGLTFPDMAPGEVRTFAMRFHVPADAPEGARLESSVFFFSDTNGTYDELSMWVVVHTPT
jgi:hypothetical protein